MANGDQFDFSSIYEAYRSKVVAYAAKLIGRDEAEDVAQEVFVKVRRALPTLTDPAKLPAWIYAITLNTVRDMVRRRSSRGEMTSANTEPSASQPKEDDPLSRVRDERSRTPEEAALRREMVSCYLDHVNQLRPSYRDVYLLSEFEQLANVEIARRLSVSVATVKIRLHRARSRLFEQLRRNCHCYYNGRGELMGAPNVRQPRRA